MRDGCIEGFVEEMFLTSAVGIDSCVLNSRFSENFNVKIVLCTHSYV